MSVGTAGEWLCGVGTEWLGRLKGRQAASWHGRGWEHRPPCAAGAPLPAALPELLPVTAITVMRRRLRKKPCQAKVAAEVNK